ncbi:hypothetical protein J4E93_002689 [Alternaria ventricosa]|uniref:uncharacterized protein n=1 Tax=Alternaria ventricosa TaxID=1187951 RepID=UPI0020C4A0E6|nr:uncharacterized protein J4E93_002689 [Alternaria ventricosa]KAI4650333.1 hypothetical protein J4E93_002689 [Alternaria ventricosa]
MAHRDPASTDIVDYCIRGESNHLYEEPDVDEDIVYRIVPGDAVTDEELDICAGNFSSNYGVWSWRAHLEMGMMAEYGKSSGMVGVRMSAAKDRIADSALVMHYDIGRSTQRDLVGMATVNPYSLCAILRVFGRGIEVLPSKPDWEKCRIRHTPLLSSACEPIVGAAPVSYIRNAKLSQGKLIANTKFFVDHATSEGAMKRILHSMNQQVSGPWEWLFGCLETGYEYVCILDYSYDQEYKMDLALFDTPSVPNEPGSGKHAASPSKALFRAAFGSSRPPEQSPTPVRYADIDRYLLEVPESCVLDPNLSNRAHASLHGSMSKLIYEAKELIAKHLRVLPTIMGAKQIPRDLRRAYQTANLIFPLPGQIQTWGDFVPYVNEVFEHGINAEARMLILQAIHFQELRELDEREQRERAKNASALAKVTRSKEKKWSLMDTKEKPGIEPLAYAAYTLKDENEGLSAKPRTKRQLTPTTPTRKPLAPKSQGLFGTAKATAKTPTSTPRSRATSMFSSLSPFRRSKRSKSRSWNSSMAMQAHSPTPATPETAPKHKSSPIAQPTVWTPASVAVKTPISIAFVPQGQGEIHTATTPPTTPPSAESQPGLPHYMTPTVGSMQRYETCSPQLFYDDESDGCSKSNVFGRFSLKNGAKTLDRTQGMRG